MLTEQVLTLLVLVACVLLLAMEWLPVGLVGVVAPLVLVLCGVLPAPELWKSFSAPAVVAVGAMFVMSAALSRTGSLSFAGDILLAAGKEEHRKVVTIFMIVVAAVSAFVTNTTVVLVFLPIALHLCAQLDEPPSRYLMPLSFAAIFGGMVTLVGTSTNVILAEVGHGAVQEATARYPGMRPFEPGMWSFTPMGLCFVAAGILYMVLVGTRLLPKRFVVNMSLARGTLTEYVTEVEVLAKSSLAGRTIEEVKTRYPGLRVLQHIRGEASQAARPDIKLSTGDVLLVKGAADHIVLLDSSSGFSVLPEVDPGDVKTRPTDSTLGEVIVPPTSRWIGRKVKDIAFRARYGVSAIAVQRHGHHIRESVGELRVEPADMLLVQGPAENLRKLRVSDNLILIEGGEIEVRRPKHAPIALAGLVAFVGLVSLEWLDLVTAAVVVAACLILLRCLSLQEAFDAVDWSLLFLLAGSLALGKAVDVVNLDAVFADLVKGTAVGASPIVLVGLLYLFTSFLTDLLSNGAVAALMVPLVVETAGRLCISPTPLLMTVGFAASAAFLTPYGYQTNLIVYGPGGYRFRDFVVVGLPLRFLFLGLAMALIPVFYPFAQS
jgi:di/tricarboxylate transporter